MAMQMNIQFFDRVNHSINAVESNVLDTCGCILGVASITSVAQLSLSTLGIICSIALRVLAEISCFVGGSSLFGMNIVHLKEDLGKLQDVLVLGIIKGFIETAPLIGNIAMAKLIYDRNQQKAQQDVLDTAQHTITELEVKIEVLKEKIRTLEGKLLIEQSENRVLQDTITGLVVTIAAAKAEMQRLMRIISNRGKIIAAQDTKIENLENQILDLNIQILDMESKMKRVQAELTTSEDIKKTAKAAEAELQEQILAKERRIQELEHPCQLPNPAPQPCPEAPTPAHEDESSCGDTTSPPSSPSLDADTPIHSEAERSIATPSLSPEPLCENEPEMPLQVQLQDLQAKIDDLIDDKGRLIGDKNRLQAALTYREKLRYHPRQYLCQQCSER